MGDEVFEYGESEGQLYSGWVKASKSEYGSVITVNMIVRRPIKSKFKYLINTNHHLNLVDITAALSSIASQENCDSEEYDLMVLAANYIHYLRSL